MTEEKADVIYVRKKVIKKLIVLIIDLMFMIEKKDHEEVGFIAEKGIIGVQAEVQVADQEQGQEATEEGIHTA